MAEPIDIVIAWVDGADPAWRKEKAAYSPKRTDGNRENASSLLEMTDDREERYRDWELLPYWFRGVEQCAPWVNKIYFVTWGHLPAWLNTEHPKLEIVRHEDYLPEEIRPTFNSHAIELNFHRIKGLSEQFLYFNDDHFLIQKVKPEDFFRQGKPRDMLAFQPVVANAESVEMPYIYLNNAMLLAKYFKKRENVKKQPGSYFHIGYPALYFFYNLLELMFPRYTGFYTVHGVSPLLKSTYEELWEKEGDYLAQVSSHKFRSREDVSQYALREWQKLSGNFVPANVHKELAYFDLAAENEKLYQTIRHRKAKMICINDANQEIPFEKIKEELRKNFQLIYPEKSAFEKGE